MVSVHITQVKKEYQQMGNLMVMNDMVWYILSIYTFTYIIEYDLKNLPEVNPNICTSSIYLSKIWNTKELPGALHLRIFWSIASKIFLISLIL